MMIIRWTHCGKGKMAAIRLRKNAWFTFYHDAFYRAVKWDMTGKQIVKSIKRE